MSDVLGWWAPDFTVAYNSKFGPHAPHTGTPYPPPALAWLDFFEQLLTPAGDALADGLALDGTHLNPQYVRLLEAALPA